MQGHQRKTYYTPEDPHSAVICSMTGCGKTSYALNLLEGPYKGVFEHIVIVCPIVRHNKTYLHRSWIWYNPDVFVVDHVERLHDYLQAFCQLFQGKRTLYLIDDMSTNKELMKKKDMLSELAFSGWHASQSMWVLSQWYMVVLKDLYRQTQWTAFFHCKDRDSFDKCLRENDIIPPDERATVRKQLAQNKHAKLVLKTCSLAAYCMIGTVKFTGNPDALLPIAFVQQAAILGVLPWFTDQYIRALQAVEKLSRYMRFMGHRHHSR